MSKSKSPAKQPGAPFGISRERDVVDIDAINDVAGFARVNGRTVAVHHLDAMAYRALKALAEDPDQFDVITVYDAAERACPELTRDEIDRLSGLKIAALLSVAEAGVKTVEGMIPNGPRSAETPMTKTTSSPSA